MGPWVHELLVPWAAGPMGPGVMGPFFGGAVDLLSLGVALFILDACNILCYAVVQLFTLHTQPRSPSDRDRHAPTIAFAAIGTQTNTPPRTPTHAPPPQRPYPKYKYNTHGQRSPNEKGTSRHSRKPLLRKNRPGLFRHQGQRQGGSDRSFVTCQMCIYSLYYSINEV